MPARTPKARDRQRAQQRAKYEGKKLGHTLDTRGRYPGPLDENRDLISEGQSARCTGCGALFMERDFQIGPYGHLDEPDLCLSCRCS